MTEIAFYHLERSTLEQALPALLEKTLKAGKRALVLAGSEARVEALAGHLWTYAPDSWLPHGTARDGSPEDQPVWLAAADENPTLNPNGAEFLFLTDGAASAGLEAFERCFELFDGRDEAAVVAARDRWQEYKAAGHDLTYWRQGANGGWEKKQEAKSGAERSATGKKKD